MMAGVMAIRGRDERLAISSRYGDGYEKQTRLPLSPALESQHRSTDGIQCDEPNDRSWIPDLRSSFDGANGLWTQPKTTTGLPIHSHLSPPRSMKSDSEGPVYCWERPMLPEAAIKLSPAHDSQRSFGYGYGARLETGVQVESQPGQQLVFGPPILGQTNYFQLYSDPEEPILSPSTEEHPTSMNRSNPAARSPTEPVTSISPTPSFGFTVDWLAPNMAHGKPLMEELPPPSIAANKRKHASPGPAAKKSRVRSPTPNRDLSDFVMVFENAPGALSTIKHRRKLEEPVRKSAQAVRKAGACHQCRFRKRTCSTGTPCTSCLKNGNGLHELKCQRESPFLGRTMSQYFEYSSTRRVLFFNIPEPSLPGIGLETIEVDGINRVSLPIRLQASRTSLQFMTQQQRSIISGTKDRRSSSLSSAELDTSIVLLESDPGLGIQFEQWAVEYTSKFIHAAGPSFYPTTMAMILGTAYVKAKLPESSLVTTMLRVASLSFVLRAGVRVKQSSPCSYRTVQASIDTILYRRLRLAETSLFAKLQRLIFRNAGYLTRQQIYPVALVLWQMLRMCCIASSHLSNISSRFKRNRVDHAADHQFLMMKLVLSTHLALFRSSCPLLFDFEESENRELFMGDEEVVVLAKRMGKVVRDFRGSGFKDMKGSLAYRREYFDMHRRAYDGL